MLFAERSLARLDIPLLFFFFVFVFLWLSAVQSEAGQMEVYEKYPHLRTLITVCLNAATAELKYASAFYGFLVFRVSYLTRADRIWRKPFNNMDKMV